MAKLTWRASCLLLLLLASGCADERRLANEPSTSPDYQDAEQEEKSVEEGMQ